MILFPLAKIETDPFVIVPEVKEGKAEESYTGMQLFGKFRRVWPSTGIEVNVIRKLAHRVHKFAPLKDGGVIISEDAFQNITGRGDK